MVLHDPSFVIPVEAGKGLSVLFSLCGTRTFGISSKTKHYNIPLFRKDLEIDFSWKPVFQSKLPS